MDPVQTRLEALEQQMHTVTHQLRWWRGLACGLIVLALMTWALPSGKAADAPGRGMAERMATLEKKLAAMDFDEAANEVVISGANLRIVNGLGTTDTTNGLGNLIVGYHELRSARPACEPSSTAQFCIDTRTGSHNVVLGQFNNFSSFGGLVVGRFNEISGEFASVSAGTGNLASGGDASVSGGIFNTASGNHASVSGGEQNIASGERASISGGSTNRANGNVSSISGGAMNTASAFGASSVSGGRNNTASGDFSSVSGGLNRTAPAPFNWAAGALFSDQ